MTTSRAAMGSSVNVMLLWISALAMAFTAGTSTYVDHTRIMDPSQQHTGPNSPDYSFYNGYGGSFHPQGRPKRDERIRLSGGHRNGRCLGRVEVRRSNDTGWSSLCADGWDYRDAAVACYALGCGMLRQILVEPRTSQTPATRFTNAQCVGVESSLFDCPLEPAGSSGDVDPLDKDGLLKECLGGVARVRCAPPCHLWRSDEKYFYRYKRTAYRPFRFHSHTPACSYPLCGHPGAPGNGKVLGRYLKTYGAGTVLGFECDAGYRLKGSPWLHCTHAGLWSDHRPVCEPLPGRCPLLPQIPNGSQTGSTLTIGSMVKFTCDNGYRLVGANTLTCVANNTWSDPPPTCICDTTKDLLFVLDESGSVQPDDFARQIDFVEQFVRQYQLGPATRTQVALIRYGSSVQLEFNLNQFDTQQGVLNALASVQYVNRGNTNTGGALSVAAMDVFVPSGGVRPLAPDATRVCVVVTDGQSNVGPSVQVEADTLRQLGVRVIAIGVGSATDRQELEVIASQPSSTNVFELAAFDQFNSVLQNIRDAACAGGRCCCPDPGTPVNGGSSLTNSTSIAIGTSVTFTCDESYVVRGSPSAVCVQGLVWSQPVPTCGLPVCEDPGTPLNSVRTPNVEPSQGFDAGDTVTYTCRQGYQLLGAPSRTCQAFGQWSGQPAMCMRVCCGDPGVLARGRREGDSFCFGDVVTYECNSGYKLQGQARRQCLALGRWSAPQPQCVVDIGERCSGPCTPTNGQRQPTSDFFFNVGEQVVYTCDTGYFLRQGDPQSRSCQSTGQFTGTCPQCISGCTDPGFVSNGVRAGNSFGPGDQLRYRCVTGYLLAGQSVLTCQADGTYDSPVPMCTTVTCPDPGLPVNSVRRPPSPPFAFGTELQYSCVEGYTLEGNALQTCLSNGQWFGTQPTCNSSVVNGDWSAWTNWTTCTRTCDSGARVRFRFCDNPAPSGGGAFCAGSQIQTETCNNDPCLTCPTPAVPLGGSRSGTGPFEPGSMVTFTCQTGYVLSGGALWTCQSSGKWQPEVVACDLVNCQFPGAPDNGRITGTQFTFNRTVTFDCNRGYNLQGNPVRRCRADGSWTGALPACLPTLCPIPALPPNGQRSSDGPFLVDSSVTFSCDATYSFQGTQTWMCLPSGEWNANQARCERLERCDSPGIPDNGFLSTTVWPEGATISYSCRDSLEVVGDVTRTCQRDQNNQLAWTGTLPICQDPLDKDSAP